jgi:fructose-specific phosphotransferase system IIC component
MPTPLLLKTLGYLVSTLSVLLLGAVAWNSVGDDPALRACVILGMLSAIAGMGLRWASFFVREREEGNV